MNFRVIDERTIGLSLDETTGERDLLDIWKVFNNDRPVDFQPGDLLEETEYPAGLRRTSSFLQQEVFNALQLPRVREAIAAGGYEPDGRPPAEFRKFVRLEFDRYGEMVRVAQVPKE